MKFLSFILATSFNNCIFNLHSFLENEEDEKLFMNDFYSFYLKFMQLIVKINKNSSISYLSPEGKLKKEIGKKFSHPRLIQPISKSK